MLRIIQAGMGGWGRDWAKSVLPREPEVELVACVDADAESLATARKELDLPAGVCFTTLAQAMTAVHAEAVLVTANLEGHVPLAQEALRAGKHVLLEKPFAPSLAQAKEVADLAARRKLVLMISQNYRFFPAVQVVRELVRSGELGAVGAVSVDFRRYANAPAREGHRHYTIFHPLLADMSIHHFDLMRAILGQEPVDVVCRAWNPPWSNFQEPAAAFAMIGFDGGSMVSYRGCWVSPGPQTPWAGEWRMECAGGEISWTSRDNFGALADRVSVKLTGKRPGRLPLPDLPQIDRAGSLRAFARAIATGEQPESSGLDNLSSLALMYAAIDSAATGTVVRLT